MSRQFRHRLWDLRRILQNVFRLHWTICNFYSCLRSPISKTSPAQRDSTTNNYSSRLPLRSGRRAKTSNNSPHRECRCCFIRENAYKWACSNTTPNKAFLHIYLPLCLIWRTCLPSCRWMREWRRCRGCMGFMVSGINRGWTGWWRGCQQRRDATQ